MPRVSPEANMISNIELEDGGILPGERPDPPDYLSDGEKRHWVQLVDNYPPHYFTIETQPLLEALIGHVFIMKKIMKELRNTSTSKSEFREWSKLFTEHSDAAGKLAARLRLTQTARIGNKTANKFKVARTQTPIKSTKAWDVIRN